LRKDIIKTIRDICKNEFNIEVNVWDIGETVWVYSPSKLFKEGGQWNITNDRWSEEVSEQERKIYTTLQRVLLSIDRPPKFFCFILSDIQNIGVDWYRIVFIPDIVKYSLEQQAIGYVSSVEINKRIISFYRHVPQALGDKDGKHINKHDINMEEFIALLVKQEMESEFYLKEERKNNFDINQLEVFYSQGKLNVIFEIALKKYQENLPKPLEKAEEIVNRLLSIYSEFHNINQVTIRDNFNKKTKELKFSSHKQKKMTINELDKNSLVITQQADFYIKKGDEYYYDKKYNEAIENYQKALNIDGQNINALSGLGNVYFLLGDYLKSIEYYSKVLTIEPNYTKNQYSLGLAYLELAQYEKAIEYFQEALENDPENEWLNLNIGSAYLNIGEYNLAVKYFLRALDLEPKFTQAYYYLGLTHFYLENYGQAIFNYEKVLEIDLDYFLAYYQLGWTYYILGKDEKAIEYYQKGLELKQDDNYYVFGYNNLSLALIAQKRYQEAINYLQKALSYEPDNFNTHFNLGYAYYGLKDYLKALADFNKAAQIESNNPQTYAYISLIYNLLGDKENAQKNYIKAKELFQKQGSSSAPKEILDYLDSYLDQQ
jgi:tetratricopeptide (TPR) repeat protein